MPRRHRSDSTLVESDSFLDVVANIVGILIILIVIAGVRVGQTAALPPAVAEADAEIPPEVPAVVPVVAPRPTIVRLAAPPSPPLPTVSPALLASIEATRRDIDRLAGEQHALKNESESRRRELAAVLADLEVANLQQSSITDETQQIELAEQALVAEHDELQSTLRGIGRQISDVPTETVTVLQHKLNPIGREVRGNELHFRLAAGRVAKVPIEELVERLKPQIEKQKEWIAKYHRQQGKVGPVDGFSMEYVVERQQMSMLDELRAGAQMMRITVTGWKVVPEPRLRSETADEALHPDSNFMSAIRLADRNSTLTFWVYPDSFDAYRKLQAVAHAAGLSVAARPLPDGVPIAGSPSGSRSSSQ